MIGTDPSPLEAWLSKWFIPLLTAAILINAGSLFVSILEPDGALYATIAKTIARSGDWINLRVEGKDWLDKPHFPFWMAASSMRIFGISGFAYKLPALLFWGVGAWYTWRMAISLYGKGVGQLSVLIYVSAAHLVISNNDVRAEPYLMGLVIGAVYHLYKASGKQPRVGHLVAGALMAACAMMTKGFFVLITIAAGFIVDWVAGRQWEQFTRGRWWIALLLIGLFIIPELYCLYIQFDLHPEKEVFGRKGVSGIRFFFWDSQFGRFFNTGPIRGQGDPFFYFHTLLWAFLPWSLLLYAAVVRKCGVFRKQTLPGDLICLGASLVSFVMFSLSRFQLPHYLNPLFPFFSILTAGWVVRVQLRATKKVIGIAQSFIALVLPALLLLLTWSFHGRGWQLVLIGIGLSAAGVHYFYRGGGLSAAVGRSYCIALLAYVFVNFIFYPGMLRYQAGTEAGQYAAARADSGKEAGQAVCMLEEGPASYSFEFYCPGDVRRVRMDRLSLAVKEGPVLVFIPAVYGDSLVKRGCRVEKLRSFPHFHISQLTGAFIYYRTRAEVLEGWSLCRVW